MKSSNDSSQDSLENILMQRFGRFSLDTEIHQIAEQLRQQVIAELESSGEMCKEKQDLIRSVRVEQGAGQGEYLVVANGEYGKDLEFGTRNTAETPFFFPALNTVRGSIGNCLQGALKRALLKARRFRVSR